jgi:hypothetical protein
MSYELAKLKGLGGIEQSRKILGWSYLNERTVAAKARIDNTAGKIVFRSEAS